MGIGRVQLVNVSGTINTDEVMRFRKLVFRATRGNALVYFSDIKKPIVDFYGVEQQKTVYCVLFQDSGALREKVTKICDSFLGQRFDIPTGGVEGKINEVTRKIKETISVMRLTRDEVRKYLVSVNTIEGTNLSATVVLKWFILKEKTLYTTLNKLKFGDKLLVGLFWTPLGQVQSIREKVDEIKRDRNVDGPQIYERKDHGVIPPSYFKTNAFTSTFQLITNTYGVPDYKEVNPSVFGCVTFPFLFGVMYGDMAHGFCLFFVATLLVVFSDQIKKTSARGIADVRYLLWMMGFFAIFNGICYNDFASIPFDAGSCYTREGPIAVRNDDQCMYKIGFDPIWVLC